MNFKQIPKDTIRAKSLIKASSQAIETANNIELKESTSKTILRELYEGLREYCEAIGYLKGYKFSDHISITCFLEEKLNEKKLAKLFDRYRKLRNGINYYGKEINLETVKNAKKEIPSIIQALNKFE